MKGGQSFKMRNADWGMRIVKENQKNPKSEITESMLFAHNALASGPQACFFAEKTIAKVKVDKGRFSLARIPKIMLEKNLFGAAGRKDWPVFFS